MPVSVNPSRIFKYFPAVAACLFSLSAAAQHNPYEVIKDNAYGTEESAVIETDPLLFYSPLGEKPDLFTDLSSFNFSMVRYSRRGYGYELSQGSFYGIDLASKLTSTTDYTVMSMLRRSPVAKIQETGLGFRSESLGTVSGVEYFSPFTTGSSYSTSVSLFSTDRRGRMGMRASVNAAAGENVNLKATVYRKWGRDATVKGVFTDEISFLAGVDALVGTRHNLSITFIGGSSENGLRSSATAEAFELTGDNYYNPSWGYQDAKVRNSRTNKRFQPMAIAAYRGVLNHNTTLHTAFSARVGKRNYTALSWFDAATPYPDYYRYMPGYADNSTAQEILTGAWTSKDPAVTQVNWDKMYSANSMNPERSVYFLESRYEDVRDFQGALYFESVVDDEVTITYGVKGRIDNTRYYKKMKDLFGGAAIEDYDQYLYEDEIYGDLSMNNVLDPGRKVNEGDRFGYDYYMRGMKYSGFATLSYDIKQFSLLAGLEYGQTVYQREGNYEKELYPGSLSYGRSDKMTFDTYTAKVSARYAFNPKHHLSLSGMAGAIAPVHGNVFLSPDHNNYTAHDPKPESLYSVEGNYRFSSGKWYACLTGYYTRREEGRELYNYYDDISSTYTNMEVSGISREYYGAELSVGFDISPRFDLSLAGALGKYKYVSDADVTLINDATKAEYVSSAKTYLHGFSLGNTQEKLFTAELRYNTSGWIASANFNYAGGRYVSPNPLRRMERAYNLASSPEAFVDFVSQEKLPDAATVDLFLLRSFRLRSSSWLTFVLSVNNLFNKRDIIYGGYEQMRIMRRNSSLYTVYTPFDSKYTYAYGRGYYASITLRF